MSLFADPEGEAQDPLLEGDVIANITNDPHIHYFQNKIN
jgi:NAD:arginine ADP-ribosyltransferase